MKLSMQTGQRTSRTRGHNASKTFTNRCIILITASWLLTGALGLRAQEVAQVWFRPAQESLPVFSISPKKPTCEDIIEFSARTDDREHSNPCFAAVGHRGHPSLHVNSHTRTVHVDFVGLTPEICAFYFDPVSGVQGRVGPLALGSWTLEVDGFSRRSFRVTPLLTIERVGKDIRLSWPASADEFKLQKCENLDGTKQWIDVEGPPQLGGNGYRLTIDADGSSGFFRLHQKP